MKKYKLISPGIYKKEGEIILDQEFLKNLYKDADNHPRYRSRILIHKDTQDIPQEMVIAFTDKSIVEVSTHLFPESFTILKGVAKYIFYSKSGDLLGDIVMSPFSNRGYFYCFIPKNTFHRFIPYSRYSLAHEIGFSNFSKDSTTLFLDKQFKEISSMTNEEYSYMQRKIYNEKLQIKIYEEKYLKSVIISGKIIYLSYDLVKSLMSFDKVTLINIDNGVPEFIKENILILQPGQKYEVSKNEHLKTVSIIDNQVNLELTSSRNYLVNLSSSYVFSSDLNEEIISIFNHSAHLSVVKFMTTKK